MLLKRQDDPAPGGDGPAGKAAARSSWDDDDLVLVAVAQHGAYVLFVAGEDDGVGLHRLAGGVVAVRQRMGLVGKAVVGADDGAQGFDVGGCKHRKEPLAVFPEL